MNEWKSISQSVNQSLTLWVGLYHRLTAFVMKSFARASHQIYVEQQHITDAQAWLAVRQKENGCFRTTGTLLNNALKVPGGPYLSWKKPQGLAPHHHERKDEQC